MSTCTRLTRRSRTATTVVISLLASLAPGPSGTVVDAAPCWFPPVDGTMTDPYREPPCPWCAGNRGIEFAVGHRAAVRAAASGRVEFVGWIAGVGYVVVRLANGWRHTYGQIESTTLASGDIVLAGDVIARVGGTFFFGLRIGDDYADPAPFIGTLRSRARLVPVDATPARPAPPPRPRCREPETAR